MTLNRRQFVTVLIASGAAAAPTLSIEKNLSHFEPSRSRANPASTKIDFRYSLVSKRSTSYPVKAMEGGCGDGKNGSTPFCHGN